MDRKTFFFILLSFFILTLVSFALNLKGLDPDFGWHLKTGELILQNGVPKVDWYSFTMPDFPWVDHEWLTDVLIFISHTFIGFDFLLGIFSAIAALAFLLALRGQRKLYYILPLSLGFLSSLPYLGVRPQIITALFIVALVRLLDRFLNAPGSRVIFFTPLLFIAWANLHGGFFAGLFILFFVSFLEIFKKTKIFQKIASSSRFLQEQKVNLVSRQKISLLLLICAASFLATLINPYGVRIYEEVFRSVGDSYLGWHIAEWLPLFAANNSPVIFGGLYLALFLGLLLPQYKKIEFSKLALIFAFLTFSIMRQRHFLIFVVLTIPIFAQLVFLFRQKADIAVIKSLMWGRRKFFILLSFAAVFAVGFYPYFNSMTKSKDRFSFYPEKAIAFIKTIPSEENIFNEYDWGGYLIWRLPERKTFIDGRMPSWRKNGNFAFGDFLTIIAADPGYDELLEKYQIKIALLKKNRKTMESEEYSLAVRNEFYDFFQKRTWLLKVLGLGLEQKNLFQKLTENGWKITYEDDVALVLQKQ